MERAQKNWWLAALITALACALALALAPAAYAADVTEVTYEFDEDWYESYSVNVDEGVYRYVGFYTATEDGYFKFEFDVDDENFYECYISSGSYWTHDGSDGESPYLVSELEAGETYEVAFYTQNLDRVDSYTFASYVTKSLADAVVTLVDGDTYSYTGEAIEPEVVVMLDGVTLIEGEDYRLSYADATAYGSATVYVIGIGEYWDSNEVAYATYTIVVGDEYITELTVDVTENGSVDGDDEKVYFYSFTPAVTGWYEIAVTTESPYCDTWWNVSEGSLSYGDVSSVDDSVYLKAGVTYYIVLDVYTYGSGLDSLGYTITVQASSLNVTEITQTDVAYAVDQAAGDEDDYSASYTLFTFTADEGGTYTITLAGTALTTDESRVSAYINLWNGDWSDVTTWWPAEISANSGWTEYLTSSCEVTLEAGETCNFVVINYSTDDINVTVSVSGEGGVIGATDAAVENTTTDSSSSTDTTADSSSSTSTTTSSSSSADTTTSSTEVLAETGDGSAVAVAGIALMGAAAMAAGLASRKRRVF